MRRQFHFLPFKETILHIISLITWVTAYIPINKGTFLNEPFSILLFLMDSEGNTTKALICFSL